MVNDNFSGHSSLRKTVMSNFEAIIFVGVQDGVEPHYLNIQFPFGQKRENGGFTNSSIADDEHSTVELGVGRDRSYTRINESFQLEKVQLFFIVLFLHLPQI